jgi:hypothetical protein
MQRGSQIMDNVRRDAHKSKIARQNQLRPSGNSAAAVADFIMRIARDVGAALAHQKNILFVMCQAWGV